MVFLFRFINSGFTIPQVALSSTVKELQQQVAALTVLLAQSNVITLQQNKVRG